MDSRIHAPGISAIAIERDEYSPIRMVEPFNDVLEVFLTDILEPEVAVPRSLAQRLEPVIPLVG
jgi:hypothetical protein